jgi:3-methylfumaryl-CoA hydratase
MSEAEIRRDVAAEAPLCRLAALLDHDVPPWRSGEVPPLGHWLYFLPDARQASMGEDGHPLRTDAFVGEFPRRMWAGGRIRFEAPIPIGSGIERATRILASRRKSGRSGDMMLVTLEHRIRAGGVLAIVEEQDLVYRKAASPSAAPEPRIDAVEPPPASARIVTPDEVALFRFSALTFNAHRIHYDRTYARQREGYPDLVVHGPFLATLLVDRRLREEPGARLAAFSFRAERPAFCGDALALLREGDSLSVHTRGQVAMRAEAST